MFGLTSAAIIALSIIAVITDLKSGKIYNWLTLPACLLGLVYSFITFGLSGGVESLFGMAVAVLCMGWMYWLGFLGAGDVKLLMAYGAWMGPFFSFKVAVLSVLIGGVLALGQLGLKRRLPETYFKIADVLAFKKVEIDRKLTMPYGLALAIAAIVTLFWDPLTRGGIL